MTKRPGTGTLPPLVVLLAYVAGVLVLGALSAPWVHAVLEAAGVEPAFHKFCLRWVQALALIGLWPALRALQLNLLDGFALKAPRGSAKAAGHGRWQMASAGLLWGAGSLAVIVSILLFLEVRVLREGVTMELVATALVKATVTAMAVSLLEELWFRGGLFTVSEKALGLVGALTVTSLLYASVHFVRADTAVDPVLSGWTAGFEVLGHSLDRFSSRDITADFVALTVAGLWAGMARHLSGSLWLCVGLHAGWVLVIQTVRRLSASNPESDLAVLAGQFDGVIGWLAAAVLGLACLLSASGWSRTSK